MKKTVMLLLLLGSLVLSGCGSGEMPVETETLPPETTVPETTQETLPAMTEVTVLADHVPAVLQYASRGQILEQIADFDETHFVVKVPEGYGLVEKSLVKDAGEPAYEVWTGYGKWNLRLYDNRYLSGEGEVLPVNQEMEVLEDLGSSLLIRVDGREGYADPGFVSKYRITGGGGSDSYDGDSGSSGGGSSGGGQDGNDIIMGVQPNLIPLLEIPDQSGAPTGKLRVLDNETPVVLGWYQRLDQTRVVENPSEEHSLPDHETLLLDGIWAYLPSSLVRRQGEPGFTPWDGFAAPNAQAYDNYLLAGKPAKPVWTNMAVKVLEDLGGSYLIELGEGELYYMAKDKVSETRIPVYSGGGEDSGSSGGSGGSGGPEWSDPIL